MATDRESPNPGLAEACSVLLSFLFLTILAGCGDEGAVPVAHALSRIEPSGDPWTPPKLSFAGIEEKVTIVEEGFEAATLKDWGIWAGEGIGPQPSGDAKEGERVLRFGATPGSAIRHIEVSPSTKYLISVFVRGPKLIGRHAMVIRHHVLPEGDKRYSQVALRSGERQPTFFSVLEEEDGWKRMGAIVETAPTDRYLTVVLSNGGTHGGTVKGVYEYDDLRVALAGPATRYLGIDGPLKARKNRMRLGANEDRWGVLSSPGDETSFDVEIPAPLTELHFAGAYVSSREKSEQGEPPMIGIDIAFEGQKVGSIDLASADRFENAHYEDHRFDLGAWAGRSGTLTFRSRVLGDYEDPDGLVLIGSPRVVTRGSGVRPNVIVISLDTLRADRIGAYGYEKAHTPTLDRLAAEGVLVEHAYSTSAYTNPSHASLLSGQYPRTHGLISGKTVLLDDVSPLLARTFADAGYFTIASTGGGFVDPNFGFSGGFDVYTIDDPFCIGETPDARAPELETLIHRLSETGGAPFFLFLQTYATHDFLPLPEDLAPFMDSYPPDALELRDRTRLDAKNRFVNSTAEDARILSDLYDGTVKGCDRVLGHFLEQLQTRGLLDNSLIVVLSDHGEEFFEHGGLFHRHSLCEEVIRVPMIWWGNPFKKGLRVPGPMSLVDVAPTILSLVGLPIDPRIQGRDYTDDLNGIENEQDDAILSELQWKRHQYASLNVGPYKLLEIRDPEDLNKIEAVRLFDLEGQGEHLDLSEDFPDRVSALQERLHTLQREQETERRVMMGDGSGAAVHLSPEARARLEALGYVVD